MSTRSALGIIRKIAPHWNDVCELSSRNTSAASRRVLLGVRNDISIDTDRALNIFLGDYGKVADVNVGSICSKEQLAEAERSLVIDKRSFNSLPSEQKSRVLTFLAKFRSTFNKVCIDSANVLFKNIENSERKYNYDLLYKEVSSSFRNASVANLINSSMARLFNEYNKDIRGDAKKLMKDKIAWCCFSYLPLVDHLAEEVSNNKCDNIYRQFSSKNLAMDVFPIIQHYVVDDPFASSTRSPARSSRVSGGNAPTRHLPPPRLSRAAPVIAGGSAEPISEEITVPADTFANVKTATSEYIMDIMEGQRSFNKRFEQAYKDLTKSLYSVSTTASPTLQSSSLNGCLHALRGIAIDSPKTSYKISGFYSAKNWNPEYIRACNNAIDVLQKDGQGLFDETIKCIRDLVSILEDSRKQSDELIKNYIVSVKISSESIRDMKNISKIECKLTKQELNRYREAIARLEQTFTSISNQSSVYSTSLSIDTFLDRVNDRNDLIREYFRNKETQLKLNGSASFNNDRVEMLLQFNNQIKQCMLYLNTTVDTKLAEYRKEKNSVLTDDKLFSKFERAMIMFKDLSNNSNLRSILDKLLIVITGKNIEGHVEEDKKKKYGLELIKIVQKFWKESGYVDFIMQLYNEFGIFKEGFNWPEFRDNITLLLAIVNITISTRYSVFVKCFDPNGNEKATNGGVNSPFKMDPIDITDIESTQLSAEKISKAIIDQFANTIGGDRVLSSILPTTVFNTLQQMFSYGSSSDKLIGSTQIISSRARFEITLFDKQFSMTLTSKKDNTNSGELRLSKMLFDAMLVNVLDVINSYTSVKYTGNFRLPIQLSNVIRGGSIDIMAQDADSDVSEKVFGANVFDVLSVNDNNYDGVIVDATPFYVCAFNVLLFYYSKYDVSKNKNADKNVSTPSIFFTVPKISPLYPIYKKIATYNITETAKLNVNLIKTGIGVFNNYWRKADGVSPGEKLSAAIDILLNELNACMVYSSKLQFDALQITGKLTNNFLQNLNSNIQDLTKSLQGAINEAVVDMSMDAIQQTELFENLMKNDLNKVRAKSNSDEEKLTTLVDILTKTDEKMDASNEIYKFIDFAVMPMLETLVSYNNVLRVYAMYISDDASVATQRLDLNKVYFVDRSSSGSPLKTYPEIMNRINGLNGYSKEHAMSLFREQLMTSSIVNTWNTIILANTIDDAIENKMYDPPKLWYPNILSSWPSLNGTLLIQRKESVVKAGQSLQDIQHTLYQLYPYVNGKNMWDYFEASLSEFTADIDHCFHLLMSYPNINDKFIKTINNSIHNLIDDDQELATRLKIDDGIKRKLSSVPMKREFGFIRPPKYHDNYFIPQFINDKNILQQMVVYNSGEYVPTYVADKQRFVRVDGYQQNILVQRFNNIERAVAEYSWTDWVVQKIAECDTSFACIPFKFIEALRAQSTIAYRVQPIVFDLASTSTQPLAQTPNGKYVNPVTANIIARSISDKNIARTDDNGKISTQWLANLIGLIPYMVNKLKAYYQNVSMNTEYEGVNVKTELNILLTILANFYNDIVSYCPRVGFMDNIALFDNNKQYHAVAEIIPYLCHYSFENPANSSFSKYIWANKYFFGTNADLLFPETYEFDRFSKIKEFGGSVFNNSIFANEFNTVISILGKAMIVSGICMDSQIDVVSKSFDTSMFRLIASAIYHTSELIPKVHKQFVNNVVRIFTNDDDIAEVFGPNRAHHEPEEYADYAGENFGERIQRMNPSQLVSIANFIAGPAQDDIIGKYINGSITNESLATMGLNPQLFDKIGSLVNFGLSDSIAIPKDAYIDYLDALFGGDQLHQYMISMTAYNNYDHTRVIRGTSVVSPSDRVSVQPFGGNTTTSNTKYLIAVYILAHFLTNGPEIVRDVFQAGNDYDNGFITDEIIAGTKYYKPVDPAASIIDRTDASFDTQCNNMLAVFTMLPFMNSVYGRPKLYKYILSVMSAVLIIINNGRDVFEKICDMLEFNAQLKTAMVNMYKLFFAYNPIDLGFTNSLQYQGSSLFDPQELNFHDPDQNHALTIGRHRIVKMELQLHDHDTPDTLDPECGRVLTIAPHPLIKYNPVINDLLLTFGGFPQKITGRDADDSQVCVVCMHDSQMSNVVDRGFVYDISLNCIVKPDDDLGAGYAEMRNIVKSIPFITVTSCLPVRLFTKNGVLTSAIRGGAIMNVNRSGTIRGGFAFNDKRYAAVFDGILDPSKLQPVPFGRDLNDSPSEIIKNACRVLNNISEYKIIGLTTSHIFSPTVVARKDQFNVTRYLNSRLMRTTTPDMDNYVRANVYVFPPEHGAVNAPVTRVIGRDDLGSMLNYNDPTVAVELNEAIDMMSKAVLSDFANRKFDFIDSAHGANGIIRGFDCTYANSVTSFQAGLMKLLAHIGLRHEKDNYMRKFDHVVNGGVVWTTSDFFGKCVGNMDREIHGFRTIIGFSTALCGMAGAIDALTGNPANGFDTTGVFFSNVLRATLLSQVFGIDATRTIISSTCVGNDFVEKCNRLSSALTVLLQLVYIKCINTETGSVFKNDDFMPIAFSSATTLVTSTIGMSDATYGRTFMRNMNIRVPIDALIIRRIEQPYLELLNNSAMFYNVDSYTSVYNMINPLASLLNASGSILANLNNESEVVGIPSSHVLYKDNSDANAEAVNTQSLFEWAYGFKGLLGDVNRNYINSAIRSVDSKCRFDLITAGNTTLSAYSKFAKSMRYNGFLPPNPDNDPEFLWHVLNLFPSVEGFRELLDKFLRKAAVATKHAAFGAAVKYNAYHIVSDMETCFPAKPANMKEISDKLYDGFIDNSTYKTMNDLGYTVSYAYYVDYGRRQFVVNKINVYASCKSILEKIKTLLTNTITSTTNTGFAYNVFSGGDGNAVNAGAFGNTIEPDIMQLVTAFISNPSFIGSYYSPSETYKNIYKLNIDGRDAFNAEYRGNKLYTALFKYTPYAQINTAFMFALIINYFHKYTVSFNSIYNSVVFPSIIYGSAVFSTIAKKYAQLFGSLSLSGRAGGFGRFIKYYMQCIAGRNGENDPSTFFEAFYSTDDTKTNRNVSQSTYDDLNRVLQANDGKKYSLESMVSINDKLLSVLQQDKLTGHLGAKDFLESSLLGVMKRIDAVETFVFIILLITKYMSYYNIDTEEDVPYSGQVGPNPLGYNITV